MNAIEISDLCKSYDGEAVLHNLNMQVPKGAVYGLLGRNGAGKTTCLRLLMGLLNPDAGRALILGEEMRHASPENRSRVAYVSQNQQMHNWMTPRELNEYLQHFYPRWQKERLFDGLNKLGLSANQPVGLFSGGEQRQVAVLLAVASCPDVLLLDEPAAGLDPLSRHALIAQLIDLLTLCEGCTIMLSTHLLNDLEKLADHIGVISNGRLGFSESLDSLQSSLCRVQVIFPDQIPADFRLPGEQKRTISGPVLNAIVRLADDGQLDYLRKNPDLRLQTFPLSLEECFVEYLGQEEFV